MDSLAVQTIKNLPAMWETQVQSLGWEDSIFIWDCLVVETIKNLPAMWETWVPSLGQEDLLEKDMATTPVLLPGKFHGQRSLEGYSP